MHTLTYLSKIAPALDKINSLSGELHGLLSGVSMSLEQCTIYQPAHFMLAELVPKSILDVYKGDSLRFLDIRILWTADAIWEFYNQDKKRNVYINDWSWNGKFDSRGFRPASDPDGAAMSQHRYGRAIDFIIPDVPSDKIRKDILANLGHPAFRFITEMETDTPHVHVSCAITGMKTIRLIKP